LQGQTIGFPLFPNFVLMDLKSSQSNLFTMKTSVQAAIFQFPVVQADLDHNLNYIYQGLNGQKADLIVLPELSTTGYFLNSDQWKRFSHNQSWEASIDLLIDLAKECDSHILITLPKMINNKLYNIAYVLNEEGIVGAQAKIHITDDEKLFFSPNPIKRVEPIDTDFGKIGVLSCFDLWNSALVRQIKSEEIDLICSPCAFGSDMTPAIGKSRTLEFSTPLILCNRIGKETCDHEAVEFVGMSTIWNAKGNVMAQTNKEEIFLSVKLPLPKKSELPFCKELAMEMNWN
jgi:predicted amidohydrolase